MNIKSAMKRTCTGLGKLHGRMQAKPSIDESSRSAMIKTTSAMSIRSMTYTSTGVTRASDTSRGVDGSRAANFRRHRHRRRRRLLLPPMLGVLEGSQASMVEG